MPAALHDYYDFASLAEAESQAAAPWDSEDRSLERGGLQTAVEASLSTVEVIEFSPGSLAHEIRETGEVTRSLSPFVEFGGARRVPIFHGRAGPITPSAP
jgi:hypothetical protein